MASTTTNRKIVGSDVPNTATFYCSICGVPMSPHGGKYPWLNDIVVMHGDFASEVLLDKVAGVQNYYTSEWTPIYDAWVPSLRPSAIPMHKECFTLIKAVLKSSDAATVPFKKGGPPTTMFEVYQVLIARAFESRRRAAFSGLWHILSPSGYGGIACCTLYKSGNCGHLKKDSLDALLINPTHYQLPMLHQDGMPRWPLPTELVQMIFDYALEDLSGPCNYVFPPIWWQKQFQKITWMKDIATPSFADFEQLVRQAWQIEHGAILADASGLTNRGRIWKIVSEMRFNDCVDLRHHYCRCRSRCLALSENYKDRWCNGSWSRFRQTHNLPAEWRPTWKDLRWLPPRFNPNGRLELFWDPDPDEEVDQSCLRHFEKEPLPTEAKEDVAKLGAQLSGAVHL